MGSSTKAVGYAPEAGATRQDKAEIISDPLSRVKFIVAIILCFVRSHLVAHPMPKILTPVK